MQDKAKGIRTHTSQPIKGHGFPKAEKAARRDPKPSLPYRPLYREETP
jgi:hypothetical protein